ncbi:hmg-3, partial [Pristionchus pacificus]
CPGRMADAFLEFNDVFVEEMGVLAQGSVKLSDSSVAFRNESTGKVLTAPAGELHAVEWARLATTPGLRLIFEAPDDEHRGMQRTNLRIGGFKEKDQDRISKFIESNWNKRVKDREHALKGWNYGDARIKGPNLEFSVDGKLAFEVPLQNVNKCVAAKNEATLEFQDNDDAPVALTEMRFFMAEEEQGEDRVEAFRQMVLKYAGIETETGQAVATLEQILCMTPRGRYDIKVYPNHLSLHGKTYDYKIPTKSITRLFLVPHKDGRHMYFVISLNPPIRQGQTRYHYLVIEFVKDEHVDFELGMTQEQLNELYDKKLDREQSGNTYEIVSRIFRALVNMRITVPGNFVGHSGTPAISCAHKQASGFLYPLEKGLLYIHKPPMYVRFDEISNIHFARSDVSTRSFDFELELKSGSTLVFNSVEKEEYNKLFDFINNKGLRIRNAKKTEKRETDRYAGSDDEHDAYAETVKAEGKEKGGDSDDSSEDDSDYDLDKDLEKRRKLKEPDEFSGSEPDEEWDSDAGSESGSGKGSDDAGSGSGSGSEDEDEEDEERPKKKKKSEPKERKEKKSKDDGEKKTRKKKEKKDPNAPKRGMSAFMLWMGEARAGLKKEGDSIGDVAKKAGELWKTITGDEKKKWEKKAAEDKERYEREMKEYKKNGGSAAAGGSGGASTSGGGGGAAKKKTERSPTKNAKSKEFVDSSDSGEDSDDKP